MKRRLLVTGAGTGPAENLIRSLRAGEPSLVITGCHDDRFALRASAADAKYLVPPRLHRHHLRVLRTLVERKKIDLVIPTSDADVRRFARARRAFGRRVFLPRTPVIELCQDKYALTTFLRRRGVPVPRTRLVRRLDDVAEHFRGLGSGRSIWCRIRSGHGGLGALLVKTPAQARSWIAYWISMRGVRPGMFTLSEYLPGRDFSCQSLWRDGTLVLTKTFERLVPLAGGPGPLSVAALAKTVYEPRVAAVCEAAIRAVDRRASGVFCFDLRENAQGVPCLTEINAGRFGLSMCLCDLVGKHNMASTYVRLALDGCSNVRNEYDSTEGYYMVRDLDMLASIFHADELADGIEDERP
jgi:carbamoyl-phosphate synthase large subunit